MMADGLLKPKEIQEDKIDKKQSNIITILLNFHNVDII